MVNLYYLAANLYYVYIVVVLNYGYQIFVADNILELITLIWFYFMSD